MPDKNYELEFDSIVTDVTREDIAYRIELRNLGQLSPNEYERNPVFDNEYTGPRFRYGLTNAPYNVATVPKGEIQLTYKPEDKIHGAQYGTIEYPYQLHEEQIHNFKLIDIQSFTKLKISSNNNEIPPPSREQYENTPPFTEEYTGPRFKYGFRNRPYSMATCPKGSILMTYREDDKESGSRHGTIEYPFQLTKDEVYSYELVDFEQIKENNKRFNNIRIAYAASLKDRGFTIGDSNSKFVLAEKIISPSMADIKTVQSTMFRDENRFHVTFKNESMNSNIDLETQNIEDFLDRAQRMLKHIDKELAKVQEDTVKKVAAVPASPIIPNESLRFDGHGINDHEGTRIATLASAPYDYSSGQPKPNPVHETYGYRLASVNDLHEALQDCILLLQSPGMKEVLEKQRTIDTSQSTTGILCKSYLESSVDLRIEQGTKALAAAVPPPDKVRSKPKTKSSGMER